MCVFAKGGDMKFDSTLRLDRSRSVRRRGAIAVFAAGLAVIVAGCASTVTPTAAESSVQPVTSASSDAPVTSAPPQSSAPAAVTTSPAAPATTVHAAAAPNASLCGAPTNPYRYNFCSTSGYITSPPADICDYFDCIANFSNGHGYMVECNDGTYSMSGGIGGACSDHGGEERPVVSTTHAAAPPVVHTTAPAPKPPVRTTQAAPPPKPSTCGAPSNPYGYNFCGKGGYITSPQSEVCSYFNCIANFFNGHGYMVECKDATYSMSGGISGACSHHGGEDRPVYSG